jgi:alanyl-tRNA synthetase
MSHAGSSLRSSFLGYFEKNGHTVVKSSPLVPHGDATLLFTNAGMVQFKDVFTGRETRPYQRAASSQKCVRAGGKHNDLDNVGKTARHHTFFEMLGNFSFGNYFKEGAIEHAWNFLTKDLGIDKSRLSVTVFEGDAQTPADEEAEALWRKIAGPTMRITRHGAKDNFWQMGDTGPCGPCTEVHFDRGEVKGSFGGDDPEGDRVLEIWNCVFMQYERLANRSLQPLPAPSVDTGMGLERLAMVMNGHASNYDTDLLRPVISLCEDKAHRKYTSTDDAHDVAMRVVADHARTTAFLIADGVLPGRLSREYVLRSIMRRAVRFGSQLGFNDSFLHEAALRVVDGMGDHYPELKAARSLIEKVAQNEEEAFRRTLSQGLERYHAVTASLQRGQALPGDAVFTLKETYGFPEDMTAQMAQEQGFVVDWGAFEAAKVKHAEASSQGGLGIKPAADRYKLLRKDLGAGTSYTGFQRSTDDVVVVDVHEVGHELVDIVCQTTPAYAESGGQVGDRGLMHNALFRGTLIDTQKESELHVHRVQVERGRVSKGDKVTIEVDIVALGQTKRNHSATHLLHHALRHVLGDHVTQKGSLVDPQRLRFDFAHFEAMTPAQIERVEDDVNAAIQHNHGADIATMNIDAAKAKGAMMLFGEKYGDDVRVVGFGPSVELCGGVHVARSGDIGMFKITSEGPVASGVRRIEAVTGVGALAWVRGVNGALLQAAGVLKAPALEVPERIARLQDQLKDTQTALTRLQQQEQTRAAGDAVSQAVDAGGIKLLATMATGVDAKGLRDYADKLRDKLQSGVVVVGLVDGDKATLLVAVTPDVVGRVQAGKLVGELAAIVGGKGGGKPDLAQAGGTLPGKLPDAFARARELVTLAGGATTR